MAKRPRDKRRSSSAAKRKVTMNRRHMQMPVVGRLSWSCSLVVALILFWSPVGGAQETGDSTLPLHVDTCIEYHFNIIPLFGNDLPYRNAALSIVGDTIGPRDASGIKFFERNGRLYYHPVAMCQRVLALLDLFQDGGDSALLNMAKVNLDRLVRESVMIDSAMFFPYRFDYRVHGRADAELKAPWYSGMAQGQALSAFSRYFGITGDSVYVQAARQIFRTLGRQRGSAQPWVVFTDSAGCFWIEEYPTDPEPSRTLNGFVFATYGLYDYLLYDTGDSCRMLFEKCLSTVKNYLPLFRRPQEPSYYGLTFRSVEPGYHFTHVEQLMQLYRMTGDSFFVQWADTLRADYDAWKAHDTTQTK